MGRGHPKQTHQKQPRDGAFRAASVTRGFLQQRIVQKRRPNRVPETKRQIRPNLYSLALEHGERGTDWKVQAAISERAAATW
jgi:hypothetical protein